MTTTTNSSSSKLSADSIRAALVSAGSKQGLDLSTVRVVAATLDRTWGDRVGFLVCGLSAELCQRAADWVARYLGKHSPAGTYGAQRSIAVQGGEYLLVRFASGTESVCRPMDLTYTKGHTVLASGIAVSSVYYPCAD